MITASQFPDLQGKTALPAMSKGHSMHMNKLSHPLVKTPQNSRVAAPKSGAQTAINSMKEATKLGQLASFAAQTQLRKPK